MSLLTWKEEFYPVEACDVAEDKALDHSITKWKGLTEENMKKHNVMLRNIRLVEGDRSLCTSSELVIANLSCSLCQRFHDDKMSDKHPCIKCPIFIELSRDCSQEYRNFLCNGLAEPMIKMLEKVKVFSEKK